jgi:hypothetical protein
MWSRKLIRSVGPTFNVHANQISFKKSRLSSPTFNNKKLSSSPWSHGLRRGFEYRWWHGDFLSVVSVVFFQVDVSASGTFPHPEEFYRPWCVTECEQAHQ